MRMTGFAVLSMGLLALTALVLVLSFWNLPGAARWLLGGVAGPLCLSGFAAGLYQVVAARRIASRKG